MSIRTRIMGGFLGLLLLTAAVAAAGWQGLEAFARHVAGAQAAQQLAMDAAAMVAAGDRAGRGTTPGNDVDKDLGKDAERLIRQVLADIALVGRLSEIATGEQAVLEAPVGVFRAAFEEQTAQQGAIREISRSLTEVTGGLQAVATAIADAQAKEVSAARTAFAQVKQRQAKAAVVDQLMSALGQNLAELQGAQAVWTGSVDPADAERLRWVLDGTGGAVTALRARLGDGAAAALAAALDAYTGALDAALRAADGRGLDGALALVRDRMGLLRTAVLEERNTVNDQMEEAQDRLTKATDLRDAALTTIGLSNRAQAEGLALVASGTDSADLDESTGLLLGITEEIYFRVADPDIRRNLGRLRNDIGQLRAGAGKIVAAKSEQRRLTASLYASAGEVTAQAERLRRLGLDRMEQGRREAGWLIAAGVLFALVIGSGLAWGIGRGITGPLAGIVTAMRRLARGEMIDSVPGHDRRDELRTVAEALDVFRANILEMDRLKREQDGIREQAGMARRAAMETLAASFDRNVHRVVETVGSSARSLQDTASRLSATTGQASGEASSAADAASGVTSDVQTVAAATEELSASIGEIGQQMDSSVRITAEATAAARESTRKMAALSQAASEIEAIVQLIHGIAEQTNLLALNATIEAARAGEAGRGFAVVAGEVKQLASQTSRATESITGRILSVQRASQDSAQAIQAITDIIGRIDAVTEGVSDAVEKQGIAIREIATGMQRVAGRTGDASKSIGGVSAAMASTDGIAGHVLAAATALAGEADSLRVQVDGFLKQVASA
ncbi:HAMP domain-containing methyl-accepting chemotaxis protein [Azospirillum sp. TSH64]|uniref:methyl-accepting chemotaxis protein n=1 Tax=Azospirillum sp. TSH64 TaxID=652740 RepID=UPI000D649C6E|nr:HAMP domain-containing methyl-accepting chemotaxis protein [Azospirillum sp. TSH64]